MVKEKRCYEQPEARLSIKNRVFTHLANNEYPSATMYA